MAFSIVADYKVIKLRPFRLNVAADISRTFDFELPGQTESSAPMIVSYFLLSSNDFALNIEIDVVSFATRKHINGPERCVHYVGTGGSPFPPGDTAIQKTITFTARRGEAFLGDVVLWFQRRASVIDTATGGIVADYKVIKGANPVRLRVDGGAVRSFEFVLPQAIQAGGARDAPMILTFLLVSRNSLHLTIAIDGAIVSDHKYTNGTERCIQEVVTEIPADPLRKTMTFTVLEGEAVFRNAVLWFQRAAEFENVVIGGI
jgi:hypothetical protein